MVNNSGQNFRLSIIFPCYNEAGNISKIIESVKTAIDSQKNIQIILVDNGSTDETSKVLKLAIENDTSLFKIVIVEKNIGYGHGIMKGVQAADGDVIAWTHADFQTDPADVIKAYRDFIKHPKYPNCILKGKRIGRNPLDAVFTFGMSILSTMLLKVWLFDVNAQPKMFHRNFLQKITAPPLDFSLDLYLLFMARLHGIQILEHPVNFGKRLYGEAKGGGSLQGKWRLIQRTWRYMLKLKRDLKR